MNTFLLKKVTHEIHFDHTMHLQKTKEFYGAKRFKRNVLDLSHGFYRDTSQRSATKV